MKKIPTLFERQYANHKVVGIKNNVHPGMEWVLDGEGVATIKVDGSCCAVIGGVFYKRFDAKKGRRVPDGAIPCCDPDPVTGHWPHWVKVKIDDPQDKWFYEAYRDYAMWTNEGHTLPDGTYEAIGKHFNGNPYGMKGDTLFRHGTEKVNVERTFEGIKEYLRTHAEEGLVFWKDGEPMCKIKRTDFGFEWPIENEKETEKNGKQ